MKIIVSKDGPYLVSGNIPLRVQVITPNSDGFSWEWKDGETFQAGKEYNLCRCGQSRNKPFCDNSHLRIGFRDPGNVSLASGGAQGAPGTLRVLPRENGPFLVEGAFTLVSGDSATSVDCAARTAFCRCGQSRNKPFCDGSHAQSGFTAP